MGGGEGRTESPLKIKIRFNGYSDDPFQPIRINIVVVADTVATLQIADFYCLSMLNP